jgi:ketosteroid isomerase-like protein
MPASRSAPAEVVRDVAAGVCRVMAGRLSPALLDAEVEHLADLYAERTDVRHPMSTMPPLLSRDDLRHHFGAVDGRLGPDRFDVVDDVVHETLDPEVVVFEFSYAVEADGRRTVVPCIFVVRVRDGQIVESRDYVDHRRMAEALAVTR